MLKIGKAHDTDGIKGEMLKYEGVVVECMLWIDNLKREQSEVLNDWRKPSLCRNTEGKDVVMIETVVSECIYLV